VRLRSGRDIDSRSILKGSGNCPTFRSANPRITFKGIATGGLAYTAHWLDR
jgi:hypothetical protein